MFDNPFSMVVAIVLIVSIAGVLRAKFGDHGRRSGRRGERDIVAHDPDAARLHDEVRTLKERVAVLERIATDKTNRLEHEIEALRDRD